MSHTIIPTYLPDKPSLLYCNRPYSLINTYFGRPLRALLTLVFALSFFHSWSQVKQNKFALLIGSPLVFLKDENGKLASGAPQFYEDLTQAVTADLKNMKELLIRAGYSETEMLVLADTLLSKAFIEHSIDSVVKHLTSNATFLLYFTGHGQQIPDRGVKDEIDSLDETLLLPNEFWVDDDINTLFATKLSAFKNIFIADACYTGSSYQIANTLGTADRSSTSHNFIDDYFYQAKIVSENGCTPFLTQSEKRFSLLYFGATGDLEEEKAGEAGSWLTSQIDIVSKKSVFSKFNYRDLACYLSNRSRAQDNSFAPVYVEIGDVAAYNLNSPLKP